MGDRDRPTIAMDAYAKLIVKADGLGRFDRKITQRPAPPAPILAKPQVPSTPAKPPKSPKK